MLLEVCVRTSDLDRGQDVIDRMEQVSMHASAAGMLLAEWPGYSPHISRLLLGQVVF